MKNKITDRKNTEALLKKKTEEMRLLLDTIDIQVWYLTDIDTYGRLNRAHADFLGLDVKKIANKRLEEFVSPEVAEVCRTSNIEVFQTGRPVVTEEWIPNAAGEKRLIAITKTPKLGAGGDVEYVVCAGTDITERRRDREALCESKENLQRFFDSIDDLMVVATPEGRVRFTNQAARAKLGYSEREFSGMRVLDWHRSEDRGEAEGIFDAMFRGERRSCPLPLAAKDGAIIPVDTRVWFGQWGGEECVYGICKDLSAEQEAHQRFERIFRHNPSAMALSDLPGRRFSDMNDAFCKVTGYARDEVLGKTSQELGLFANPHEQQAVAERLLAEGRISDFELQIRRKNGSLRTGLFFGEIITSQGRDYLLTIMQDITERVALQERLKQMHKHESISRMAGAVAHLFNNQLAVVIGNLELLAMDMPQGAGVLEYLEEARKASQKAAETSRLLLTYLGQSPGRPEQLDLARICRQRLGALQSGICGSARITSDLPEPGPIVQVDPAQLNRVVDALIINAAEALHGDGNLCLTVYTVEAGDIPEGRRLPLEWKASAELYACFAVADTGSGIDKDTIEKIFDPFFTEKFAGRGLGLPVALGIVNSSGGCITVDSAPGKGSTFRVFLPLSPETAAASEAASPTVEEALTQRGTILVVDDQESVCDMARALLECLGFEVLSAGGGAEAVEIFRQREDAIRLVITDLTMPGLNGWQTLKALRDIRPDIPVILSSGYDEVFALAENQSERPQTFLSKPYRINDLKAALERALSDTFTVPGNAGG